MTLAVLLAGTDRRDRLRDQLRRAGATAVAEPDTPHDLAHLLRTGTGPVLLVAADLVAHDAVLHHLITEPGTRSVALTGPESAAAHGPRLRTARGVITGVTEVDDGVTFLGALRLAGPDRPHAASAVEHAVPAAEQVVPTAEHVMPAAAPAGRQATSPMGPTAANSGMPAVASAVPGGVRTDPDALLIGLLAGGVQLTTYPLRNLKARRCRSGAAVAEAETEIAGVDEERARLRIAVKEHDDFFTTVFVSSWSPMITRACARLGLTPTAVTALSVLCAVAAALGFAQAGRPAMIAGAVLLYLGFVLDCVDGQLARFTRRFTPLGGWLDTMADRAKEYTVYAGLAAGAARLGHDGVWWLAIAAMALQTVRHATDSWYGALQDTAAPLGRTGGALGRLSDRVIADGRSPVYWLKRIVVFPIGERWALIGVLAACTNGRTALLAVLAWGGAAMIYTLTLRGLRSRAMRVSVLATVDAVTLRDDGWCARRLPAVTGPLDWLVPAGLRLTEFAVVICVAVLREVPPWLTFVLLFALSMHHYDLIARCGAGYRRRWEPGWDGRSIAVAAGGGAAFPVVAAYTLCMLAIRVVTR
ncbi:CDP-alcohol phosphatidyltransferase family protein [Catenuloplanes indicus]|uniref:Phosphatidylglycerophosphate synthase n=1 Tax=Catenuloplanes indicus TaxID=137267 RepID=A0AAE3W0T0_9ACTN|nr:CDP-alcohol phosphatidyltransferase family protein [Catenuloplanes indicus]MDQ0367314.1 phosphatidylglycerophosphate synthase [Catenuloplanes indicus]